MSKQAGTNSAGTERRKLRSMAVWLLLLVLAMSGVTFAWFTGNRSTNVTPESYTVTDVGEDLLISASANGPFATSCTLPRQAEKVLYPMSSADLSSFWASAFQNPQGITTDYSNITASAGDSRLEGNVYLKGSGAPLDVYLYPQGMKLSSNPQLLSTLRLGLSISMPGERTVSHIFRMNDLGSTAGATSQRTTSRSNVVVSGNGSSWNYVADPAHNVNDYSMASSSGSAAVVKPGAQKLFTLPSGKVATVHYFVYMEGCDDNCIEAAQSKDVSLQFAFGGSKVQG